MHAIQVLEGGNRLWRRCRRVPKSTFYTKGSNDVYTHSFQKGVYTATITSLVSTPLLHNLITITTSGQWLKFQYWSYPIKLSLNLNDIAYWRNTRHKTRFYFTWHHLYLHNPTNITITNHSQQLALMFYLQQKLWENKASKLLIASRDIQEGS